MNSPAEVKLVNAIITAYHTTRLSETPAANHILSKYFVQNALEEFRHETFNAIRHCDDCDFSTVESDIMICPNKECRGVVG